MKIKIIFAVFMFLVLGLSLNAFAAIDSNGVSVFMTDSNSIVPTSSKVNFGLSEIPYLYFGFPDTFSRLTNIDVSYWWDPSIVRVGRIVDTDPILNNWYKLSNWDSIKKVGWWKVNTGYLASDGENLYANTQTLRFNVTPEPVSSALFVLGAGALILRRVKKA